METLFRAFVRQIGLHFADDEMLEGFAKCGLGGYVPWQALGARSIPRALGKRE
jgi:hypothetical protein